MILPKIQLTKILAQQQATKNTLTAQVQVPTKNTHQKPVQLENTQLDLLVLEDPVVQLHGTEVEVPVIVGITVPHYTEVLLAVVRKQE